MISIRWLLLGSLALGIPVLAAAPPSLETLLRRPVIDTNLPLAEVQAFTESRVPRMPKVASAKAWERVAERLRRDTLDRVVFRGEAARWRQRASQVVWLETIAGGPEYRIRKLRYEAVPGLWIPALLYEPLALDGKTPVVLNVNGHEGAGKAVAYKQIRCINLAKRGMLVLNPEWIGMGQLRGEPYLHYRMNQLDLCGTSGVSVFYLALARALDLLLAHPQADPDRVAVSGLSGGGWQTIFISALDPRVTLANPVAGYSSFRTRARFLEDLGDSEQTPCDLATVADYTHLTAMRAPRPTLLTYNSRDNCCFASGHALEPLLEAAEPVFKLYGRLDRLRSHVNHDPGDHNFARDNRQAFYRMLGEHFFAGDPDFDPLELPCDSEVKSNAVLEVSLPSDNATFQSLALSLCRDLPRAEPLPDSLSKARGWQRANRPKLRERLRARESTVSAEPLREESHGTLRAAFWRLRVDDDWTVPATELWGEGATETVIVLADAGRRNLGNAIEPLLKDGKRVLAVDLFYFGESRIRSHDFLFALLVAAVGERALGIQAGQLAAIARWAGERASGQAVEVVARGPRSALIALAAAVLEPDAIGSLSLHESLGSLKEVIEQNWSVNQKPEMFCFGLLESFDVQHLVVLAAPRRVSFHGLSDRARREMAALKEEAAWLAPQVELAP